MHCILPPSIWASTSSSKRRILDWETFPTIWQYNIIFGVIQIWSTDRVFALLYPTFCLAIFTKKSRMCFCHFHFTPKIKANRNWSINSTPALEALHKYYLPPPRQLSPYHVLQDSIKRIGMIYTSHNAFLI